ncbi:hypothetical protein C5F59_015640 [Streptomyces sp. QL37]|uniref:hypothetical protein n=1 Tax=Streptomyces sp. QL37 TaxID=2093747 RepID=UPI000CF2CB29|nr:hypothetical protein [Streptomyces sp. QL37]PPQ59211.1 hypothetical protein C5F59_23020 [Streptomyces sp. QL37]
MRCELKTSGRTGAAGVVVGALALSAFAAPAAQAADTGITVSRIVVNGGKSIIVGTSDEKAPPVTFRITLPAGYSTADPSAYDAEPYLYHGTTAVKGADGGGLYMGSYTCYETSARVADCEGELSVDPRYDLDSNSDATTWKIGVAAKLWKAGGGLRTAEYTTASGTVKVKRWAKATVNASPEPVTKGKTITVTGSLKRADWVKHTYTGYAGKTVSLQFRKKGSSVYSTVKTATSSGTGALKTTVKASVDGYWRWTFGGSSTSGTATAAGDFVDVR